MHFLVQVGQHLKEDKSNLFFYMYSQKLNIFQEHKYYTNITKTFWHENGHVPCSCLAVTIENSYSWNKT